MSQRGICLGHLITQLFFLCHCSARALRALMDLHVPVLQAGVSGRFLPCHPRAHSPVVPQHTAVQKQGILILWC